LESYPFEPSTSLWRNEQSIIIPAGLLKWEKLQCLIPAVVVHCRSCTGIFLQCMGIGRGLKWPGDAGLEGCQFFIIASCHEKWCSSGTTSAFPSTTVTAVYPLVQLVRKLLVGGQARWCCIYLLIVLMCCH